LARLPRDARLLRPSDFKRVMSQGRRRKCGAFIAYEIEGATAGPRMGLAVSRKSMPRAVDRNRFKRLVRESFRHAELPPCDVVIVSLPGARALLGEGLSPELNAYWKRLAERWPRSSSP